VLAASIFHGLVLAVAFGVPLYALVARGREYAAFAVVIIAASLPGAVIMHARFASASAPALATALGVVFAYGTAAAGAHLAGLVRPRLRSPVVRFTISIPGMAFVAAGFLAGVWLLVLLPPRALAAALGWSGVLATLRWLDLAPFVVVALSMVTSARLVDEVVRVSLASDGPEEVRRLPLERRRRSARPLATSRTDEGTTETTTGTAERPLRIVQIADPHLGPWQPIAKLRRSITRLAAHDPDLVLLTGDFLTMEGSGTPGALAEALAPLRAFPDRCFAIFGNHDHGHSAGEVRRALAANGIRLLVDEEAVTETAVGAVQIVGADYVGRERRTHIQSLLARWPRRPGHLRLLLLHDPLGFRHVPVGDVDLTLSGHTHGGQLGLVSFGLDWTILTRTAWPDHGLFGHGSNRLYVHRGTGFYGFPLRIGVPGEASLLELVRG
jgi:predicted MPP superfamily phosphohydrolase